jgi:hypothetical protein
VAEPSHTLLPQLLLLMVSSQQLHPALLLPSHQPHPAATVAGDGSDVPAAPHCCCCGCRQRHHRLPYHHICMTSQLRSRTLLLAKYFQKVEWPKATTTCSGLWRSQLANSLTRRRMLSMLSALLKTLQQQQQRQSVYNTLLTLCKQVL